MSGIFNDYVAALLGRSGQTHRALPAWYFTMLMLLSVAAVISSKTLAM
ncbi:hypothetical protein SAMN04488030_0195 [Aliiroseovarius halocynthiae]|nr:hypothetical protein [Aliiroseovarius halocynthiae]SMR84108.1 hypothetical protein SAMN04488030_0195 [Aliiroseovarius halocynthiae]